MKKLFILFLLLLAAEATIHAQFSRYIIRLKDKEGTPYSINDPAQFLTQRSIDRRVRYNIPIDSSDLPVTPRYIDSIRLAGNVTIINVSKWLNQVCIKTTDAAALNKINSFPFVIASSGIAARPAKRKQLVDKQITDEYTNELQRPIPQPTVTDYYNYGQAYPQIHLHNGEFLHNHGFRGEGMILTSTDDGFYHYNTLPTFDSVRNNNQILGTWDFVTNDANVAEDDVHGLKTFSTIAANLPGSFVGVAPKASFYLYKTEDITSEYPIEEQNWVAAAEKSDSLGVDVITVSLGYNIFDNNIFNYTYASMNGNTTTIARAADIGAKKGILVVASMGNSGGNSWHYLLTPADGDSVLTVGAVNSGRQVASFSSYGPSSDGQIKPDVAAVGLGVILADYNTGQPAAYDNGTSFSCPIIAGLSTCLWQAFPEVNNMSIIDVIHQSSDRANNPDDRTGYGIPDVKKAFVLLIKKLSVHQIKLDGCNTIINWSAKSAADMNFTIERKLPTDIDYLPLNTQSTNSSFITNNFSYTDDLSSLATPISINYRIKMTIAADTSFILDSATINYVQPCSTYTFTGDGNWDDPANWSFNSIPPAILTAGNYIIIDPLPGKSCILNVTQQVAKGASFTVKEGKNLVIPGELILQ